MLGPLKDDAPTTFERWFRSAYYASKGVLSWLCGFPPPSEHARRAREELKYGSGSGKSVEVRGGVIL